MHFLPILPDRHAVCALSYTNSTVRAEDAWTLWYPTSHGNSPIMESLWAWIWNTAASLPRLKHHTVFPSVAAWGGGQGESVSWLLEWTSFQSQNQMKSWPKYSRSTAYFQWEFFYQEYLQMIRRRWGDTEPRWGDMEETRRYGGHMEERAMQTKTASSEEKHW